MFSTPERLQKRTPKEGIGRAEYISLLVDEYYESSNRESCEQVTANLANFSYDPINFPYLRDAKAVDLFLQLLVDRNPRLVLHGIAGLCNLCLEPSFRDHIVNSGGVSSIQRLLDRLDLDVVANALTTLMFLIDETSQNFICTKDLEKKLQQLKLSSSARIKNLATLFLQDHFSDQ